VSRVTRASALYLVSAALTRSEIPPTVSQPDYRWIDLDKPAQQQHRPHANEFKTWEGSPIRGRILWLVEIGETRKEGLGSHRPAVPESVGGFSGEN
jgi:hypothetical protein